MDGGLAGLAGLADSPLVGLHPLAPPHYLYPEQFVSSPFPDGMVVEDRVVGGQNWSEEAKPKFVVFRERAR